MVGAMSHGLTGQERDGNRKPRRDVAAVIASLLVSNLVRIGSLVFPEYYRPLIATATAITYSFALFLFKVRE